MSRLSLRLRWSWRDLRARWLQVAAIALVIGIGSGIYSGLSSVSEWRRTSYPASYDQLAMYDLRFELADGAYVEADELVGAVRGIPSAEQLDGVVARLVESFQVDASTADETLLVPGRLVGVPVGEGEPTVSRVHVFEGRGLEPADDGEPVAVLHELFADDNDLAPGTSLLLSGDRVVEIVGRGVAPEEFFVIGDRGGFFAEFAVAWAPLATVQSLADRPGQVNDFVVTVVEGGDRDQVEAEIADAITAAFPDAGFDVVRQEDDVVLRLLFDDIDGDQRFYNIFAVLILAGAAFAAFNLTGRVVEAQRREIGIGMAMGVPPTQLAVRPLLFGAQVAIIGVVFGVGVGLLVGSAMSGLLESFQPLPVWDSSFQLGVFVRGAALGLLIPFVATVLPVGRAVRVEPVEAISTTHRATRSGLVALLRRVPLPGKSVSEMPFRNLMRAPRRTLLTALGIGAAIATFVGVVGMVDSLLETVDRGDAEILGDEPERMIADLDFFYLADDPALGAITDSAMVDRSELGLIVGGTLDPDGEEVDVLLSAVSFESDLWRPTAERGELSNDGPGLVIARKAADDLGVEPGDTVVLRHPLREGFSATLVESELPVLAIHPNPFRFATFVDVDETGFMGLEGIVNTVQLTPASGVAVDDVQRALFGEDIVASIEPVSAAAEAIRDRLEEAVALFQIMQIAVLVLALLIAFNSTAINMDERARENATMLAFGVPVRSVMRVAITESVVTGVIGTIIGIIGGRLLVEFLIRVLLPETVPDIGIVPSLSPSTVGTALMLGVVAVAVAPLLTLRRVRRMNVPDTLRVME